jgi:hypothetical protein
MYKLVMESIPVKYIVCGIGKRSKYHVIHSHSDVTNEVIHYQHLISDIKHLLAAKQWSNTYTSLPGGSKAACGKQAGRREGGRPQQAPVAEREE